MDEITEQMDIDGVREGENIAADYSYNIFDLEW